MNHDDQKQVRRPALRLVQEEPEQEPKKENTAQDKARRNSLVQFMNAYADAIDHEIETILKL